MDLLGVFNGVLLHEFHAGGGEAVGQRGEVGRLLRDTVVAQDGHGLPRVVEVPPHHVLWDLQRWR